MHAEAARDADRLAGDEGGIVTGQEGHDAGVVVGHADAAVYWRRRLDDGMAHNIALVIAKALQGERAAGVSQLDIVRQAGLTHIVLPTDPKAAQSAALPGAPNGIPGAPAGTPDAINGATTGATGATTGGTGDTTGATGASNGAPGATSDTSGAPGAMTTSRSMVAKQSISTLNCQVPSGRSLKV